MGVGNLVDVISKILSNYLDLVKLVEIPERSLDCSKAFQTSNRLLERDLDSDDSRHPKCSHARQEIRRRSSLSHFG